MRIELVVVPDCPHTDAAGALMRRALDDVGLRSLSFEVVTVESVSEADELHFVGSPTFMVEGRDLFDEPIRPAALACRIYRGQRLPELPRPASSAERSGSSVCFAVNDRGTRRRPR